jgi:hypothetical protein
MVDLIASVGMINGRHCRNRIDDQSVVMDLLNEIPISQGGTMERNGGKKLWGAPVAGRASSELHQAILTFQRTNRHEGLLLDGHVDPGQACIRLMNRLAAAPREDEIESSNFSVMFLGTQSRDSAVISCTTEAGTSTAVYLFTPAVFGRALLRRLKANTGNVVLHHFTTPEPMRLQSFSGPARLVPLSNFGLLELSQYRFTGNRRDGGVVQLSFNCMADGSASDAGELLSGAMVLLDDKLAGLSVTPLLSRGVVPRPRRV